MLIDEHDDQPLGRLEGHGVNAEHTAEDEANGLALGGRAPVVAIQRRVSLEQGRIVATVQASEHDAVETGKDLVQADLDEAALLLEIVGQMASGLAGVDDDDDMGLLTPVPARAVALLELVAEGDLGGEVEDVVLPGLKLADEDVLEFYE